MNHIRDRSLLVDHHGDYFCLAAVFTTSQEEWTRSVKKYLRRHSAEYACLRLREDKVAVINDWGEGVLLYSGEFLPTMVGTVQPFETGLEEIFAALDCSRRPISASTNWRLTTGREGDGEGESEWERVNSLTGAALRGATAKLQKWGVPYRTISKADKVTIHFRWPVRFSPGDIAYYEAMLAPITRQLKAE